MKFLITACLLFSLCSCSSTTIYMVRHAEKADTPVDNPPLTADGLVRAQVLREVLEHASIDAIIVSDYQRTQLTAQPLADYLNLPMIVIPLKDADAQQYVQGVVDEINNNWSGNNVLLVSHNGLMQQIGPRLKTPPIPALDDKLGYDDFFVITTSLNSAGPTKTIHIRYGAVPGEN